MCGIAGIYNSNPGQVINKSLLQRINQKMTRRGPDHNGLWYANAQNLGLAHNRLAIIDLHERADEPMQYMNGRYVITYNGEIYNYRELKKELIKRNYRFNTDSDTEVIMAMYDCYGSAMLDRLRGMFAFAIWDQHQSNLFAARDPFGIKPLYYYWRNATLIFCSQVKPISTQSELSLTPCATGWCGYFRNGSVPEPYTIYQQIKALPAGHYLELDQNSCLKVNQYFSVYDEFADIENSQSSQVDFDKIDLAFSQSVEYHLVADVPVALFLSSGIDSTVLAYYLSNLENKTVAYTLDFDEFDSQDNESKYAVQTAKRYGLEHNVIKYTLSHDEQILDDFFIAMDQPSIDGLNVWLICQALAKADYRAVISGLGADEVLAGYSSFVDVPKYAQLLRMRGILPRSKGLLDLITYSPLAKRFIHPKVKGFTEYSHHPFLSAYQLKRNLFLDNELDMFFDVGFSKQGLAELNQHDLRVVKDLAKIDNTYLKISALEIHNYMKNQLLRDADWASMYYSIEMRVPFVDLPLIKACASELVKMPKPSKPMVIKQTMKNQFPEQVLFRKKTGFVTPVETWLKSLPSLQSWKSNSALSMPNCPWARRWAYEVKNRFV